MEAGKKIVEVRNLCTEFPIKKEFSDILARRPEKSVKAVNDVSFDVYEGESLGLVGESGCGKSTLAKTIVRLCEAKAGTIKINGRDITNLQGKNLRAVRKSMQMIFQDPYSSLNPRMTVYETIAEILKVHKIVSVHEIPDKVNEILAMCGLNKEMAERYPGEFSGGQRQRVGIARALAAGPSVILADEPVSALDVSIQAQIINLLKKLQKELHLTMIFISHDLHVVRYISQRTAAMYLGKIVEIGSTEVLFTDPLHPYTGILIHASPKIDPTQRERSPAIQGEVPSPIDLPKGCLFHPRCPRCMEKCKNKIPEMKEIKEGHLIACHLYE